MNILSRSNRFNINSSLRLGVSEAIRKKYSCNYDTHVVIMSL